MFKFFTIEPYLSAREVSRRQFNVFGVFGGSFKLRTPFIRSTPSMQTTRFLTESFASESFCLSQVADVLVSV